jgi:uncharacterized protein (DUF983 family)
VSGEGDRFASRVFDFCVGLLLAAMALYGAVQVVTAIWVPLCVTLFVIVVITLGVWFFAVRSRRW